MKRFIISLLSGIILTSYPVVASANSITSYYKIDGKVTSYAEAFKLVQRKNKDKSKLSYYKPVKHHKDQFVILYYKDGHKKNPGTFTVKSFDHNKKVAVTNDDKLYQLSSNQHGKITNGKK